MSIDDDMAAAARTAARALPACCAVSGFTYLVRGGRLLKIGQSIEADPAKRLADLQRMAPSPLRLIALGRGTRLERMLHGYYADLREHGEWFRAAGLIVDLRPELARVDAGEVCLACAWAGTRSKTRAADVPRFEGNVLTPDHTRDKNGSDE